MKPILFLSIIGICLAQINLRGDQKSQLFANTCKNPCAKHIEDVLPGLSIAQRINYDGLQFSQFQFMNVISYCCDKQKTDKLIGPKFIVADFIDVSESHLPDILTVNATISNATKNENQTSDYKIEIVHQFQRRALNLSADINQIRLNMTKINDTIDNLSLDNCQQGLLDWMTLFNFIGGEIFYEQVLGTYINATIVFYSNETYTQEYLTSTYWNFIQNNSFQNIENAFQNIQLSSLGVKTIGGGNFYKSRNWNEYLSQLGPQDYVYTQSHILGYEDEIFYKDFNSYEIFDSYPKQTQECAKKIWNMKFQQTNKNINILNLNQTYMQY
ncbi:hypothetical protein ABPG74_019801 [Tetrahymena malaccensis]